MTETNKSGDKRISPKWLDPEAFDYLKKYAKKKNLTETAVINKVLKFHRDMNS